MAISNNNINALRDIERVKKAIANMSIDKEWTVYLVLFYKKKLLF
jgi:hypothetical protein